MRKKGLPMYPDIPSKPAILRSISALRSSHGTNTGCPRGAAVIAPACLSVTWHVGITHRLANTTTLAHHEARCLELSQLQSSTLMVGEHARGHPRLRDGGLDPGNELHPQPARDAASRAAQCRNITAQMSHHKTNKSVHCARRTPGSFNPQRLRLARLTLWRDACPSQLTPPHVRSRIRVLRTERDSLEQSVVCRERERVLAEYATGIKSVSCLRDSTIPRTGLLCHSRATGKDEVGRASTDGDWSGHQTVNRKPICALLQMRKSAIRMGKQNQETWKPQETPKTPKGLCS